MLRGCAIQAARLRYPSCAVALHDNEVSYAGGGRPRNFRRPYPEVVALQLHITRWLLGNEYGNGILTVGPQVKVAHLQE